jgi:hypothetical protein
LWRSQLVVCSLGQCLNHWNPSSSSQAIENAVPNMVLKRLTLRSQSSGSSVWSPFGQPIACAITSDREIGASMNRRPLAPNRWYSGRNQNRGGAGEARAAERPAPSLPCAFWFVTVSPSTTHGASKTFHRRPRKLPPRASPIHRLASAMGGMARHRCGYTAFWSISCKVVLVGQQRSRGA